MIRPSRPGRRAYALGRMIVLMVFVLLTLGILFPFLQYLREDGNRATCANNLRKLALATHNFHNANATFPPYWGAYPTQDAGSIKGSWFAHLLPYVGENVLYGEIMADISKTGVNWDLPATADASTLFVTASPENEQPALKQVACYNGHIHWAREGDVAPAEAEPPVRFNNAKRPEPGGIFRPQFSSKVFSLLQCPSDPSPGSYPDAGKGLVYLTRVQPWSSTNYLANWNIFANNNPLSGYLTPPPNMGTITDGLANTVLFGEAYSWCDGKGRLALNSWDYHSFGLTWSLPDAIFDDGSGERRVNYPNGMPNTYMFQVRPQPKETPDCIRGDCCNNWRAQTGHASLNVAMADGSVRQFAEGTNQKVWDHALLPRDGILPGWEW